MTSLQKFDAAAPYAIYARTSSDDLKNPGESAKIETHLQLAKDTAKRFGLTNCAGTFSDADLSGGIWPNVPMAKFDIDAENKYNGKYRPDFTKLIDLIENGKIKYLVVSDVTRIVRPQNAILQAFVSTVFKRHGVIILSAKDGTIDYADAMHDSMQYVQQSTKRQEINKNSALSLAKKKKLKENGCLHSHLDFGYKTNQGKIYVTLADGTMSLTSKITVNEDHAKIIRTIYDMYLDGNGHYKICVHLETTGIKTKQGKSHWIDKNIRNILTNPHYAGKYYANDGTLKDSPVFPAIIDYDKWIKTQAVVKKQSRFAKKSNSAKKDNPFPLTGGLTKCSCGANMSGSHQQNTQDCRPIKNDGKFDFSKFVTYYRCSSLACKERAYIKTDELHKLVSLLIDNKDVVLLWKELSDGKNKEYYALIESLKMEVLKKESKLSEYRKTFEDMPQELKIHVVKYSKEIQELNDEIERTQNLIVSDFPADGTLQAKARFLLNYIKVEKNNHVELSFGGCNWIIKAKKNVGKAGHNFIPSQNEIDDLETGFLGNTKDKEIDGIRAITETNDKYLDSFEE